MCVVSAKVVKKVDVVCVPHTPAVIELDVYSRKNDAGHYVIHVDSVWQGKRHIGFGQVNESMCNTSKALGQWVMKSMPDRLYQIGGYAAEIKIGKEYQDTYFSEVLYGLYINMKNNRVCISDRVGMNAVRAIIRKLGYTLRVESVGHVISKITLTEIV